MKSLIYFRVIDGDDWSFSSEILQRIKSKALGFHVFDLDSLTGKELLPHLEQIIKGSGRILLAVEVLSETQEYGLLTSILSLLRKYKTPCTVHLTKSFGLESACKMVANEGFSITENLAGVFDIT